MRWLVIIKAKGGLYELTGHYYRLYVDFYELTGHYYRLYVDFMSWLVIIIGYGWSLSVDWSLL